MILITHAQIGSVPLARRESARRVAETTCRCPSCRSSPALGLAAGGTLPPGSPHRGQKKARRPLVRKLADCETVCAAARNWPCAGGARRSRFDFRDRGDEPVALFRDRVNEAMTVAVISEGLAKKEDVLAEVAFLHEGF